MLILKTHKTISKKVTIIMEDRIKPYQFLRFKVFLPDKRIPLNLVYIYLDIRLVD